MRGYICAIIYGTNCPSIDTASTRRRFCDGPVGWSPKKSGRLAIKVYPAVRGSIEPCNLLGLLPDEWRRRALELYRDHWKTTYTRAQDAAPGDRKFVGFALIYKAEGIEAAYKLVEQSIYWIKRVDCGGITQSTPADGSGRTLAREHYCIRETIAERIPVANNRSPQSARKQFSAGFQGQHTSRWRSHQDMKCNNHGSRPRNVNCPPTNRSYGTHKSNNALHFKPTSPMWLHEAHLKTRWGSMTPTWREQTRVAGRGLVKVVKTILRDNGKVWDTAISSEHAVHILFERRLVTLMSSQVLHHRNVYLEAPKTRVFHQGDLGLGGKNFLFSRVTSIRHPSSKSQARLSRLTRDTSPLNSGQAPRRRAYRTPMFAKWWWNRRNNRCACSIRPGYQRIHRCRGEELDGWMSNLEFGALGKRYTVEVGASWPKGTRIADGPANPVWDLAKKHDLTIEHCDRYRVVDRLTFSMVTTAHGYNNYLDVFNATVSAYTNATIR
ncbi:hypothetical protein BV22DRAFT_1051140 [Leucogyrophana mollusca]|uniref:Uncharacterized protein n=1 Tax=Leucogyrophana mollusca TaxID=85980 RepID=A0ACB8B2D9_9AGAM|nr:hypothetical protein BV22DRAFT_1051140 [Leucogyrophana mollusca]